MKKKRKQPIAGVPLPEAVSEESISGRGKKTIGIGLGILVIGFIVLSLTDPMGRNWASTLSPFLILGGYGVIGIGIFLPEKPLTSEPFSPPRAD